MYIKDIEVKLVNIPLKKPFITSLRSVYELESIIVKITTSDGTVGYGETAPTYAITKDSKESILKDIKKIKKSLIKKSIFEFNELLHTLHSSVKKGFNAKSAIEIALYDILAKHYKTPLYKLLGGRKKEFKTGITISLNDTDTMVKDALEAQDRGFKSLKIKLGKDYKKDIKRVEKIHKVIKKDISLKLDANQGWSKEETVLFLNKLQKLNIPIDLIEQPVKRGDIEGLKYIKKRVAVPILADESVFSPMDAVKILEEQAVDLINIKLDKCGGISKALLIADICKLYGVKCMMGCMLEGAISVGAAAHIASARSDTIVMLDLDAPILCKTSPVIGGVKFKDSNIYLNKSYGLGIKKLKTK